VIVTVNLSELRATIAEIRAELDKARATVQEMTAVALRDEAVKRGELTK
jgi:hypothetical protein